MFDDILGKKEDVIHGQIDIEDTSPHDVRSVLKPYIDRANPITEDKLKSLKGKSIYGEYKVGDKILFVIEETVDGNKINATLLTITERHIPEFEKEFEFLRTGSIPQFRRKKK